MSPPQLAGGAFSSGPRAACGLAAWLQQPWGEFCTLLGEAGGKNGPVSSRKTSRAQASSPISNSGMWAGAWGILRKRPSCQVRTEREEELSERRLVLGVVTDQRRSWRLGAAAPTCLRTEEAKRTALLRPHRAAGSLLVLNCAAKARG